MSSEIFQSRAFRFLETKPWLVLFGFALCFGLFNTKQLNAQDSVIFSNNGAYFSNFYRGSDVGTTQQADDAMLNVTRVATSIDWSGNYVGFNNTKPPKEDDFTIAVFEDDNGSPAAGAPIATFHVGNDVQRTPRPFIGGFNYHSPLGCGVLLEKNTRYWFAIYNDLSDIPGKSFRITSDLNSNGGNSHTTPDQGNSWGSPEPYYMGFQLRGRPLLLGDVNRDGVVDLLDVAAFVEALQSSEYKPEADINQDGVVDLLDVAPFLELFED